LLTGKEDERYAIYGEEAKKDLVIMEIEEALNERCYGKLQGQNKEEVKEKFGEEQFLLWRRSFSTPPPGGESLEMTTLRTLPFFKKKVLPFLEKGENILIVAHGNTLRGILLFIEGLSKEDVVKLEVPTGEPIIYTYQKGIWTKR
jgi:2,3-bisphosphoglycerate-dependent phosphoglycerate mutase